MEVSVIAALGNHRAVELGAFNINYKLILLFVGFAKFTFLFWLIKLVSCQKFLNFTIAFLYYNVV